MEQEKRNRFGSFVLGGIAVLVVLIAVVGIVSVAANGWGTETFYFFEQDNVSQDAEIIHLTEEDYNKFPILKDIPDQIRVDKSPLSSIFTDPECIDKQTGDLIWETYSGKYIEHEGVIYWMTKPVS